MNLAFVDASVVLRRILGERGSYRYLEKFGKLYASELMRVEALRTIDRLRIQNAWPQEEVALRVRLLTAVGSLINFVPIQLPILRRASEPFQTIVGTLDAIHISTALLAQIQIHYCPVKNELVDWKYAPRCHSERSEESRDFNGTRSTARGDRPI